MTIKPSAGRPYFPSRPSTSSEGARQPLRAIPAEARQEAKPSAPPLEEGFAQHLKDAMALNRSRRDVYDRLSGGGTRSLSNKLIMLETLTLPAAYALDLWAKRFQKQGIPMMQVDFVSMQDVRSPFAPPRWRGVASDKDAAEVEGWLKAYRHTIGQVVGKNDFAAIAEASHELLKRLEATEQAKQTNWAMTKHLIESLGLAAMNAIDHAARSDGETLTLSRTFLRFQSLGLMGSVSVDRKAQTFHQKGIGIVVNDMPVIPFVERWEARR